MSTNKPLPRKALLFLLARASLSGNLGLFIGTGFSKAATGGRAPGFEQLLRQLADRLEIAADFENDERYKRKSLPQVASQLLLDFVAGSGSAGRFRETVADLCNIHPSADERERFSAALRSVRPSWIITTNYDLILEALFEDAESVLATQPLVASVDHVPIYHLHGHRHYPGSIRITEEDYVGLLGPIDYQKLRLPLLLVESATLMLGYGLGDINVRAAMAWSRSFRDSLQLQRWQGVIIQALYREFPDCPAPEAYSGPNDEYVLEIDDLIAFLEELEAVRTELAEGMREVREKIAQFLTDPHKAREVATSPTARAEFLGLLESAHQFAQPSQLVEFLSEVLDPVWANARENSGWRYYDVFLGLINDVLEKIDPKRSHPLLSAYLGEALDRIGRRIDPDKSFGSAYDASDTWITSHGRISDAMKHELRSYGESHKSRGLLKMLDIAEGR